jgi:streptogramin lyase
VSATRRTRIAAVAGAALAAALAASGPAHAAPAVNGEVALPGGGTPKYLTLGPDGNVWVPLNGASNGDDIAKITPDGTVTGYNVPNLQDASGIASDGTYLWVTRTAAVSRFLPANPAGAENFSATGVDSKAITLGSDGNLWTGGTDKAIKIKPSDGTSTQVPVPGMGTPEGIAAGGDGALYVASFGTQRVTRVTTAGAHSFVGVDTGNSNGARQVAAGPGNQIAFTAPAAKPRTVGLLTGGAPLGPTSITGGAAVSGDPEGITYANDGAYWVARFDPGDVLRMTPDGAVTPLTLPAGSGPRRITKGAGDTLWVGLETAKKVARITGVEAPSAPATPTTPATQTTTPTPPGLAPAVLKLKVTPNAFRRGTRPPALTTARTGSQLRFTLTKPATVRFTFAKATVGRKVGSSCVKRTRQNAKRKRCVYHTPVRGSLSVKATTAGDQRVRFEGRISARQALRPGRYRVTARAIGADGATSAPASAAFTIKAS